MSTRAGAQGPAEEARIDALTYVRSIVDTVREPLLVLDGSLRVRSANRSFYRTFRVSAQETQGQLLYDIGNRQWNIPRLRTLLEEILPHDTTFDDFEVEHDFQDIGRKVMLLNARKLRQEGSELILLAIEDVTERRRAEAERQEIEARFTTLVKNIKDHSIFTLDPEGRVTSWNVAAEHILGYTEAEALGHHFSFIFTPEDRQHGLPGAELSVARAQGRAEDERWHLRKDGERFWALGIVSALHDAEGRLTGFSKILRDMTQWKRSEQALRQSEKKYRSLIESIDEGFCIIEMLFDERNRPVDYRFLEVNPAFEKQTGFLNAEGRRIRDLAPALEQHWFEIYGRVALTGEAARFQKPAAQLHRWYDVYAWPYGPPQDRQVAILFNDVTPRKQAEEALQEANRRKDTFLATLAHELRNPLAPIRNAVEILKLKGSPDPAAQAARDIIERQVAHMVRLIDDLLDVSRITRGKLQLHEERVDLSAVLQEAVEVSRPLAQSAGHDLAVELPPDPIRLDADPVRLAQVFSNLLNNACKYTDPGGRIRLGARRVGDEVVVQVEDTGIGISPEYLPHVFDVFSQVPASAERSQTGLGIGLSLARGLVEMHGGRIEARSAGLGKGSTFTVRLPLAAAASQRKAAETPMAEHRDASPARILVVDDQDDVVESLALLLREHGNEVQTARDGLEAVEAAERFRPDLVLLDIGMPRLDGYAACKRLRAQPWGKDLTIVALTGWGQDADRRNAEEAGFDGHLVKPVDPAVILGLLAEGNAAKSR